MRVARAGGRMRLELGAFLPPTRGASCLSPTSGTPLASLRVLTGVSRWGGEGSWHGLWVGLEVGVVVFCFWNFAFMSTPKTKLHRAGMSHKIPYERYFVGTVRRVCVELYIYTRVRSILYTAQD